MHRPNLLALLAAGEFIALMLIGVGSLLTPTTTSPQTTPTYQVSLSYSEEQQLIDECETVGASRTFCGCFVENLDKSLNAKELDELNNGSTASTLKYEPVVSSATSTCSNEQIVAIGQ